jgi:hypothetical protein
VFPAQAGVIRYLSTYSLISKSVPRAGGGDPVGVLNKAAINTCSPRRRG